MEFLGLYLHIPFCNGKCPYCDFYSVRPTDELMDAYTDALCKSIGDWGEKAGRRPLDTIYFGGGTPSLLGSARLLKILERVGRSFCVEKDAEITLEANPAALLEGELPVLRQGGVNRLSLGMQSSYGRELSFLGRKHTVDDVPKAVEWARRAGFDNISLDLMLALEGQTPKEVKESAARCREWGADHVSAYLLKVEEGTPFYQKWKEGTLRLPGEEEGRELYLTACRCLEDGGYRQYEISNFAVQGKESRHNLRYWDDREYLGLGASAHSFWAGRRFYYPRDIIGFIGGKEPVSDGEGGGYEEYAMLRFRLSEGLTEKGSRERFACLIPKAYRARAQRYAKAGLLQSDAAGIRLTREGFLVSNTLIGEILFPTPEGIGL